MNMKEIEKQLEYIESIKNTNDEIQLLEWLLECKSNIAERLDNALSVLVSEDVKADTDMLIEMYLDKAHRLNDLADELINEILKKKKKIKK